MKTATDKKSGQFVPVEDRIATFDQDGTLWVEHPLYAQAEFALARLRDLAPSHAEWKKEEPFKVVPDQVHRPRGNTALYREPKPFFVNDHDGKPVGINLFIGKRPIAAFGNSSGDVAMLQWTGAGRGPHLMMLVLHDDAEREYAYGPAAGLPDTKIGTFPQSMKDRAKKAGWSIISMKNDWKRVFQ